jgi:hypothetical protein
LLGSLLSGVVGATSLRFVGASTAPGSSPIATSERPPIAPAPANRRL